MRQERDHILTTNPLYLMIVESLKRRGRDFTKCEQCGKPIKRFYLHHTKYDGATIYDIQVVCQKCNTQPRNRFLK